MAKPFGNMAQLTGDILDSYIMGLQAGSTPDDAGLDEMKYVRVDKLRRYIREGLVTAYTPRDNSSSATPSSPQVGDIFMCTGEFTESGVTYQLNHFYVYTTQLAWEDITAGIKGPKGDTGATPLLSVGEVTYGDTPDVTIDTTDPTHPVMNFVLKTSEVGVVDNLISDSSVDALSAKQGKLLKAETSDLQSQIVNTNAELDNVEALIGGDAQVENTDPAEGESLLAQSRLIHHANLLPNGSFGRVGARSVAWNQLSDISSYSTTDGTYIKVEHIEHTVKLTVKSTPSSTIYTLSAPYMEAYNLNPSHKYLLFGKETTTGSNSVVVTKRCIKADDTADYGVFTEGIMTGYKAVALYSNITTSAVVGDTCSFADGQIFDLTAMGMDSLTMAQFKALFSSSYYPYNAGVIYDLNPTSFLVRGVNLWDETLEVGSIGQSDGQDAINNNYRRTTGYTKVLPSQTYYLKCSSAYGAYPWVFFYDADKNYLDYTSFSGSSAFTVPINCFYIRFRISTTVEYQNDIQICLDSLPTAIKTAYHPSEHHTVDTPQISDGHYVNENCYDYVENVVEDGVPKGKKHTVVGSVDLGTLSFVMTSTSVFRNATISEIALSAEALCPRYTKVASYPLMLNTEKSFWVGDTTKEIYIHDSAYTDANAFKTAMSGVMLYYEKATESVTDCEPLRSFGISDYCTIEPITPQDELVNRIDVPFSVKSVSANTLIEQITQNTADIAEEKATRTAQVSALNKRVTNLELKTGDQFEVDYPSSTYGMDGVPANVAEYAKVTKLRGVSRVNNQLAKVLYIRPETYGLTRKATADGGIRIYGTCTLSTDFTVVEMPSVTSGHSYLTSVGATLPAGCRISTSSDDKASSAVSTLSLLTLGIFVTSGLTIDITLYPMCRDLTFYFNGNIPTNAQTIAGIQTNYPWLLTPSAYGTSGVNTVYEGIKSIGVNRWDEKWEVGNIQAGSPVPSTAYFRSENYIKVDPFVAYYLYSGTDDNIYVFEYRADLSYANVVTIIDSSNHVFTPSANTRYVRFADRSRVAYANDIQICLNSLPDAIKTTHHPYMERTLTFPSPISLKSAGAVAEEYYPESGRVTHPIATKIFTNTDVWNGASNVYFFINRGVNANKDVFLGGGYTKVATYSDVLATNKSYYIGGTNNDYLYVNDSAFTSASVCANLMAGISFSYALKEPDPDTYVDPILDPYIEVEPNGTVKAVQSQSPEVDSAMTVEYMAS